MQTNAHRGYCLVIVLLDLTGGINLGKYVTALFSLNQALESAKLDSMKYQTIIEEVAIVKDLPDQNI